MSVVDRFGEAAILPRAACPFWDRYVLLAKTSAEARRRTWVVLVFTANLSLAAISKAFFVDQESVRRAYNRERKILPEVVMKNAELCDLLDIASDVEVPRDWGGIVRVNVA